MLFLILIIQNSHIINWVMTSKLQSETNIPLKSLAIFHTCLNHTMHIHIYKICKSTITWNIIHRLMQYSWMFLPLLSDTVNCNCYQNKEHIFKLSPLAWQLSQEHYHISNMIWQKFCVRFPKPPPVEQILFYRKVIWLTYCCYANLTGSENISWHNVAHLEIMSLFKYPTISSI